MVCACATKPEPAAMREAALEAMVKDLALALDAMVCHFGGPHLTERDDEATARAREVLRVARSRYLELGR